jgi:hypothetical protein
VTDFAVLRRQRTLPSLMAVSVAIALGAAACSPQSPSPSECPGTSAEASFGCGPATNSGITYQPDVVFVEGGAGAIRAWDSDGVTWTIKGDARGADQIAVGRIVYVTAFAVGRVLRLERDGGDVRLSLGPVALTDVIKDAKVAVEDAPLDQPTVVIARDFPVTAVPAGAAAPTSGTTGPGILAWPSTVGANPPIVLAAKSKATPTPGPTLPPPASVDVTLGDGGVFTPECCKGRLGAKFHYDQNGMRITGEMWLKLSKPRLSYGLEIRDGHIISGALAIRGIKGIAYNVKAATISGVEGNIDTNYLVPVEFKFPIGRHYVVSEDGSAPPSPYFGITQFWTIATKFTSRASEIKGSAEYAFGSDSFSFSIAEDNFIDLSGPSAITPRTALLNTITGASVGVTGLSVDMVNRWCVCLGALVWSTGLYSTIGTQFDMRNDSNLPALQGGRCRGAEFDLFNRVGLGSYMWEGFATAFSEQVHPTQPITAQSGPMTKALLMEPWASVPEGLRRCNLG